MNCQEARESLSTLLDGNIGLTERVPLELHVNTCQECAQTLADLQILRIMPRKPDPNPAHWRPGLVGSALRTIHSSGVIARLSDVVGRVRHFDVVDRLRHLYLGRRLRHFYLVNRRHRLRVIRRLRRWDVASRLPNLDLVTRLRHFGLPGRLHRLDVVARLRPTWRFRHPALVPRLLRLRPLSHFRRLGLAARLRGLRPASHFRRLGLPARLRGLRPASHFRHLGLGARLRRFGPVGRLRRLDVAGHLRDFDVVNRLGRLDLVARLRHFDPAGRLRQLDVAGRLRHFDPVGRLRHLVVDRMPPRHIAVVAAVPLTMMLAILVFERGFTVGIEMRQRSPSAPASIRSESWELAPIQGPAVPPVTARSVSSPAPPAPSSLAATPTKPVSAPAVDRSARPESSPRQEKPALPAPAKPAPVKSAPAPASPAAETARKEPSNKNVVVARAVPAPPKAAAVSEKRRGSVDVVGRLQVKNRSEAERDLAALVARAGGTSVKRQQNGATTVVEAAVPHAAYGKFAQGVLRLGSWKVEAERSPLPDLVLVTVRLAE